jgi:hypothetical protein
MTCSAIICDWNGTLYKDIDEEAIVKAIIADRWLENTTG